MSAPAPPLVSIVTPVFNGAKYLRECIESLLAQTYPHWDYTIVDNRSTDQTLDIAAEYAKRDHRIRVVENAQFVPVVKNYNNAVSQMSPDSKYCKVVGADDWLDSQCIQRMVELAEAHPTVAMVGAYGYGFDGEHVVWQGIPYPTSVVSGRTVCRMALLGKGYVFGTPTSLLYRADIVRSRSRPYNEANIHADMELCLEKLADKDFGFIHQVLTYSRIRDDSLTSTSADINTYISWALHALSLYGGTYLSNNEIASRRAQHIANYYRYLGTQAFRRRGREFWSYHRSMFKSLGLQLEWSRLAASMIISGRAELGQFLRLLSSAVR